MRRAISVRNLYLLFLYAWDRLPEGGAVDVAGVVGPELPNLLAKVLLEGTRHLIRRGLDQGYVERDEDTPRPRGRILVGETLSRNLLPQARAACRIDALSRDVPHNRIIKSTVARLARTEDIVPELRERLAALARGLGDVTEVPLSAADFRRVQLHGNNAFYGFLLRVCALAHEGLLPHESSGRYRFRDLLADEQAMGLVFQDFVRNFYRIEQQAYQVTGNDLAWALEPGFGWGHALVPMMQTDVRLRSAARTVLIECKWYREPLQTYYGRQKLRSEHLYQLFAYLKNLEAQGGHGVIEGILLYPQIGEPVDVACRIEGHIVQARTLDLAIDWADIHRQLLALIAEPLRAEPGLVQFPDAPELKPASNDH